MKVKRVKIENFKVFREKQFDLSAADLVVLDGPNGFGKTTVYDALELVFTGKIRRYQKLKEDFLDMRMSYAENPLYHEGNQGGDLTITVEFIKNETLYVLGRSASASSISSSLDFSIFTLFTKDNFEDNSRRAISNDVSHLTELFGTNYVENFRFLNYIEQEESTYILKNTDRNRKSHISHLFDLKDFELKLNRIEELKKKMSQVHDELQTQENIHRAAILAIRTSLTTDAEAVPYFNLFTSSDHEWDKSQPRLPADQLLRIISDGGVLQKLLALVQQKNNFRKSQVNAAIGYLQSHEPAVRQFIRFYHFFDQWQRLTELRTKYRDAESLARKLQDLTLANTIQDIDLLPFDFISGELIEQYYSKKLELAGKQAELNQVQRIFTELNGYRQQLLDKILALQEVGSSSSSCVLCGYDWGSIENLLAQIGSRAESLRATNDDSVNRLNKEFDTFKATTVLQIQSAIKEYFENAYFQPSFLTEFDAASNPNRYGQVTSRLQLLGIDIEQYLAKSPSEDEANRLYALLMAQITTLTQEFTASQIESYFTEYFQQYFRSDFTLLESVTEDNIQKKSAYIKRILYELQNEELQQEEETLRINNEELERSRVILEKVKNLQVTYKNSLLEYQRKIIRDIEIVFHIYSGRIMQSFQGGLGMFIFSDNNGIRFQSNSTKTYDAIFSMSSGQLAALVMAFTLALHKIYSQTKIILIDDPVQTMDELNIYGFIDLLRYEFSDNQVILSTHEDMMSAFMRYKFQNFNMSQTSINLKDNANR